MFCFTGLLLGIDDEEMNHKLLEHVMKLWITVWGLKAWMEAGAKKRG